MGIFSILVQHEGARKDLNRRQQMSKKAVRAFISMFAVILICAGLKPVSVAGARTKSDTTGSLAWSDIVWISLPVGERTLSKAVLASDVEITGLSRKALMQLDLGNDNTIINAHFVDRYSIVVDLRNKRFGLFKGSLSGIN
jgi:hypothetical protein